MHSVRFLSRISAWVAVTVFVSGSLVSHWLGRWADTSFAESQTSDFSDSVRLVRDGLEGRIQAYAHYLAGVQGLFNVNAHVTRSEFHEYLRSVDIARRYPGIQVTAFTKRIRHADKAALEREVQNDRSLHQEGFPRFEIKPPGRRPEYFVALYVEPIDGNEALLGFDQGSEPARRGAVELVRDSGSLTASGRILLVQDQGSKAPHPGFQLRMPVYRRGAPIGTVEERRDAFEGMVGSAFRVKDLIEAILPSSERRRLRVRIHELGEGTGQLLARSDANLFFDNVADMLRPPTLWREQAFTESFVMPVANRHWHLEVTWHRDLPTGQYLGSTVMVGGMVISCLLALLAAGLIRMREQVIELRTRTAELAESQMKLQVSEERYRNLTELSSDWAWETDVNHHFVRFSGEVDARSGVPAGDHYGKARWEIPNLGVSESDWEAHRKLLAARLPFHNLIMGRPLEDGRVEYVSISGRPILDADGNFSGYRGVGTNITAQHQAELLLKLENRITRTLAEGADFDAVIGQVLGATCEVMGWSCGGAWRLDEQAAQFLCFASWTSSLAADRMYASFRALELIADGHGVIGKAWFEAGATWVTDLAAEPGFQRRDAVLSAGMRSAFSFPVLAQGKPLCVMEFFSTTRLAPNPFVLASADPIGIQLSQFWLRQSAERELSHTATHDSLTGLPNRVAFNRTIEHAVALADRTRGSIALMFVDLDRFKQINDMLGHAAGDRVLIEAASRLHSLLRGNDFIARLGGDEFVILTQDIRERSNIARLAGRVIDTMSRPFVVNQTEYTLGCSVGISTFPEDCEDGQTLLRNSDAAMYRAKNAGRNQFQFYSDEMTAELLARFTLERGLRAALLNGEFCLDYQPKRDLASGRIGGLEALIRWNHPERGLLAPGEFIHVAEETGLIIEMGSWAIRAAMEQTRHWIESGVEVPRIAVNLSARQFANERLPALIEEILDTYALPGAALELEITETVVMNEPERTIKTMQQVRALGVTIAVDDFGTGYSSLSYLNRFPVSSLKIDRSFVAGLPEDQESATIVKALIGLGHSLGLRVVAEGVESEEQAELLTSWQCDTLQGYLISRPVPAAQMREFILKHAITRSPTP